MSSPSKVATDPRLTPFLDAASDEKALDAFHQLWELQLADKVRPYLLSQQIPAEDRSDIEAETYIRVCRSLLQRRPVEGKAAAPLTTITDIQGYAVAAARALLYSYFLAQNPAWRRLQLRVIFHLKQADKVTRWKAEFQWLAGLKAWNGMPFRAKSDRAQAFLNEQYTVFRQEGLRNQEPKEIDLAELMCRIFVWIDSPLWQNKLTSHLLKLHRLEANLPLSWEEISVSGEWQADVSSNDRMEDYVATKQALQEALCHDGLLSRHQRGVLLLKLDLTTLSTGLGMTLSQAATSMGIDLDALFGEGGELLLPMQDDRIATLLGIEATQSMTAVGRVSTFYRMTARRKLERWLQNAG